MSVTLRSPAGFVFHTRDKSSYSVVQSLIVNPGESPPKRQVLCARGSLFPRSATPLAELVAKPLGEPEPEDTTKCKWVLDDLNAGREREQT